MNPVRLLLVEDDPVLAYQLSLIIRARGYEPLGPAASGEAALALLGGVGPAPDLAVLDINLAGDLDGVDLARELLARRPLPLIFITSLTNETTFRRAKAVAPAAYLLKPFNEQALQHAVELALHNFTQAQHTPDEGTPRETLLDPDQPLVMRESLFVRERGRLIKVCFEEVLYAEAGDKYCTVVTPHGKHAVRLSLRELAQELPAGRFAQIHRGYLVQADHIRSIDPGGNTVTVGTATLPLSRTYRDDLLARLRLVG